MATTDKRPLIFLEEDVAKAVKALEAFQQTARTRANLVTDGSGQPFAQVGQAQIPPETIQALVAASTQATKGILSIFHQDELVTLTHEGKNTSLQLTHLAEGAILVTVFDAKTTVGAIVFYLSEVVAQVNEVLKVVATRDPSQVKLGGDVAGDAKGALDDMFGGSGENEL